MLGQKLHLEILYQIFLFGATNKVNNKDKENNVFSGYKIAFDGKGQLSFENYYARSVIIFCVDNNWSSHADNLMHDLLLWGEGDTFGINGFFGAPT